jgi:hypothetical protein
LIGVSSGADEAIGDAEPRERDRVFGSIEHLGKDIGDAADHGVMISPAVLQS